MANYLITRFLSDKGVIIPYSIGYGNTEVRNYKLTFSYEKIAAKQSLDSYEENINQNIVPIITTIVDSEDPLEADYRAEIRFEQVLDCLNTEIAVGEKLLLNAGFIKNLDKRLISPRLQSEKRGVPYPAYKIMSRLLEPINHTQYILSIEESELKLTILRSYHWLRKSNNETDLHLKTLFLWFAIECLAKVGEEDITGKIMQTLGFPYGKIGKIISPVTISALKSDPIYESVRRKVEKQLVAMRDLRNKTVHEGFRPWDISINHIKEYLNILTLAAPRIQSLASHALYNNLQTIKEFWEYFPYIFEENISLVDFHGNVLYMLNSQDIFIWGNNVKFDFIDIDKLK